MRPPTRMRQVYDGGPPGKFRFPKSPLTVVFVAVLAFLLVHRLGVFSVEDETALRSRLDVAAEQLEGYYDRNIPEVGRIDAIVADVSHVDVRLAMIESERLTLMELPRDLQDATLANVCPVAGDKVWDLISGEQIIRIQGISDSGDVFLSVNCSRRRI